MGSFLGVIVGVLLAGSSVGEIMDESVGRSLLVGEMVEVDGVEVGEVGCESALHAGRSPSRRTPKIEIANFFVVLTQDIITNKELYVLVYV